MLTWLPWKFQDRGLPERLEEELMEWWNGVCCRCHVMCSAACVL